MNILIYDDDLVDIKNLKDCLENFSDKMNIRFNITVCADTNQLFDIVNQYDLLFLDIELNDENGINIGLKLREMHILCRIIIITNFSKYAIDGYKIEADRYFLKPINQTEFDIEMASIINRYYKSHLGFIDSKIKEGKIYLKDILYIEFINRKTDIHFINGSVINTSYSLKEWKEKLNYSFFSQPYKSFIVNLDYISGFKKNDIILINNELIPISRHYKNEFKNQYESNLHDTL
jgi:DNA-binding LytR/AlgR family response regulator